MNLRIIVGEDLRMFNSSSLLQEATSWMDTIKLLSENVKERAMAFQ